MVYYTRFEARETGRYPIREKEATTMKKFLAWMLALIMLALPVCGLAEGDIFAEAVANGRAVQRTTTIHFMQTGVPEADELIQTLTEALEVKTYWQEGDAPQMGLILNLNATDILTVELANIGEDTYIYSDLLGSTIVIGQDEAEAVVTRFVNMMVEEGMISRYDANTFLESFHASLEAQSAPSVDIDYDALIAGFEGAAEGFVAWATGIAARVEEADLSGLPEGCDPAVTAFSLPLTMEDVQEFYRQIFGMLKGNGEYLRLLDATLTSQDATGITGEEMLASLEQQIVDGMGEVQVSDCVVTVYLDEAGDLVAMTMPFTISAADGSDPIGCEFVYTRRTEGDVVYYRGDLNLSNDEQRIVLTLTAETSEGHFNGLLAYSLLDGETSVGRGTYGFMYDEQATDATRSVNAAVTMSLQEGDEPVQTFDVTVSMDGRKNGIDAEQTTVITLNVQGSEFFTVTTKSVSTDPRPSIVSDSAARLSAMTDEDFIVWFRTFEMSIVSVAANAVKALPASILQQLQ